MAPSKQDTVKSIHASSDLILVKEHLQQKSCSLTSTKRKADSLTADKEKTIHLNPLQKWILIHFV